MAPADGGSGEGRPAQTDAKAAALLATGDLRLRLCRHGYMLYSLKDAYIGRSLDVYGEYAEDEAGVYRQLLQPGEVAVEAGANIGAHTLVLARAVGPQGSVVAVEPQRVIYQMLCANLAVNGLRNVHTRMAGVGAERGTLTVPTQDYGRFGNFGGVALTTGGPGEQVPVLTVDSLTLRRCHLLKIDVEGMELEVIEGAAETIERHRPTIYVENNNKEKSPALIDALLRRGYRLFWHLPRLFRTPNFRGHDEDIFGNTINVNMLCLAPSDRRAVPLKPVKGRQDWWRDEPGPGEA